MNEQEVHLVCHRCGKMLEPGAGNWYVVRIEAFADPSPPQADGMMTWREIDREISNLVEDMEEMSEQEIMDQVYRRLTVHMCYGCYSEWIEDPTG